MFADKLSPAPPEVRITGGLIALPGLALLVLGVILLVEGAGRPDEGGNNLYAEVAYYLVLGAGTLACAAGLALGRTWARSPGVVLALLLIGVGWYTTGPSAAPAYGVPLMALGLLAVVLLFRARSRAWALGLREGETEQEAAERGGAEGRAAQREREAQGERGDGD